MANDKNIDRLTELNSAPVGKLLWKYGLPAVVGIVVMSVYNIIDRIFIGHGVGPEAIAGLAITFPVMNISAAFGVLVGAGASARISIVLGEGNHRAAEEILGNAIVLTLVFGTIYIVALGLVMTPLLRLFGASDASLPYARDFMMVILPGLLVNNITYSYNNVMRASGYPTKAMITMFIGAGMNVVLAPLFIFVFKWGIKGAAFATVLSMTTSMVFVLAHFFNKNSVLHFRRGIYGLKKSVIVPILSIGAAPCIINSAGCVINAVINNTVYKYGGDASVAAIGIFTAITSLLVTFVVGACMGMQPIVGYNYGAHKFARVKRAFWLAAAFGLVVCTLGTVLCQCAPGLISRMFTSDAGLIAASDRALRLTTWMFWGVGFQIVVTNFFQSIGEVGKSIFMSLSRQVIFLIPLLFTLPLLWQLNGVWLSFPISDMFATSVAAIMLCVEMRKLNKLQRQAA